MGRKIGNLKVGLVSVKVGGGWVGGWVDRLMSGWVSR